MQTIGPSQDTDGIGKTGSGDAFTWQLVNSCPDCPKCVMAVLKSNRSCRSDRVQSGAVGQVHGNGCEGFGEVIDQHPEEDAKCL